jgi:hypothetical protein
MGTIVVKFPHPERPYVEWSSIVDAPITRGMSVDELRAYVKEQYGNEGLRELPARLRRCEIDGTSSLRRESAEEVILCNRAGQGETRLTMAQIVDYYCERGCSGKKPTGVPATSDSDEQFVRAEAQR